MSAGISGRYRNLFAEIGKSQEEIEAKLQVAVEDFFESDNRVFERVGNDMAYIQDTGNIDVRTEGMSYGMMICVQLDKKEDFDRLWKWTKTYMWMDSGENEGYFAWSCGLDGSRNSNGPAPDGEEFFAMALFFASHRWGDGEGIYAYSKEAKDILRACLHKGENNRAGHAMWNRENKQILFVPGAPFTDPSYHLPHFYELFALWAYEEDRAFWKEAAKVSRDFLKSACDPQTGMNAEYTHFDGTPFVSPRPGADRHDWFYSDAYRTAANIGLDQEWFGADDELALAPQRLIAFLSDHTKGDTFSIFEKDGTPVDQDVLHPYGLVAATAQGALALKEQTPESLAWLNRFWEQPMRSGVRRYYDNCLALFALLALSGKYRIYGLQRFPIMRGKEVVGAPAPTGGTHMIFLDGGRLPGFAEFVGNIQDPKILSLLTSAEGFGTLCRGIGVTLTPKTEVSSVRFVLQMYGKTVKYGGGSTFTMDVPTDGVEHILELPEDAWSEEDDLPGQMRFEFPKVGDIAVATVVLYLREPFLFPDVSLEKPVDRESAQYRKLIAASHMQTGNPMRLKRLYEKVQKKEDVTIAFIGGSITQGAGATPIHEGCYARRTYEGFFALMKDLTGTQPDRDHVHFRKVGVGGTPSELGMIRYERDILKNGEIEPDLVVVEFAVNDTEDETQGECYESLVKTILLADNQPAVILLFSVFADNWNLQDRLAPIGQAYDLPMVSVKDAVAKQFDELSDERIVTRNQYFYDKLHPSNIGHDIMADSLLYLLKAAYEAPDVPEKDIRKVVPVIGDRFVNTHLLDRKDTYDKAVISPGSFTETDTRLQAVEMDFDFGTTGEFPYNWMHTAGSEPFTMKITCRSLVLVMKDSEGADSGKAEVKVDGKLVLTADPKVVGWVHCHPMILFIGDKEEEHLIEINMIPGDEDKAFTILGFGYTQESL